MLHLLHAYRGRNSGAPLSQQGTLQSYDRQHTIVLSTLYQSLDFARRRSSYSPWFCALLDHRAYFIDDTATAE